MESPEHLVKAVTRGDVGAAQTELRRLPADKVIAVVNGAVDRKGTRLLHLAASHCHVEVMQMLLSNGADPNATDSAMNTPLALIPAGNKRHDEARDVLITKGAVDDITYFHKPQPHNDASDKTDNATKFIDKTLMRKMFVIFLVPFAVLLGYNGLWFFACFTGISLVYYLLFIGYFVTLVTVKPPWYHPAPKAATLSLVGMPPEWRGLVHNPKDNLGIDFTDVEFKSKSGNKALRGWFVAGAASAPKRTMGIVFVHGGGRDRRTWLRHLPMFHRAGYTSLLFDMQEHGTSDGTFQGLAFGMRERYDVLAAVEVMRTRFGFSRIACVGTSMGASTSIMAAAIDHQHHIDVVVAENPLLTAAHLQRQKISEIIGPYFRHTWWGQSVFNVFQFVCSNWLNLRIGNKPSKSCQALHSVGKVSPRPLLIMHGTYDAIVPHEHTEHLFALAREPKELWLAPGATHTALYDAFPEEFEARVLGFLERHAKQC